MLLHNCWVKEKFMREIRKNFNMGKNESIGHQDLGDAGSTMPGGKLIAVKSMSKKEKIPNEQPNFLP